MKGRLIMDNNVKGSLILNENHPDGTLLLPGCKLVLEYECTGEERVASRNQTSQESSEEDATIVPVTSGKTGTPKAVYRELVCVLAKIPGMHKQDVRTNLLSFFPPVDRNVLDRYDDMRADLTSIVEHASTLNLLEDLVANAKVRSQSPENRTELKRIREEVLRIAKQKPRRKR